MKHVNLNRNRDLSEEDISKKITGFLQLFYPSKQDEYWLDKIERAVTELIKIIPNYETDGITLNELNRLITDSQYRNSKIDYVSNLKNPIDIFKVREAVMYFRNEFDIIDQKTLSVVINDYQVFTSSLFSHE